MAGATTVPTIGESASLSSDGLSQALVYQGLEDIPGVPNGASTFDAEDSTSGITAGPLEVPIPDGGIQEGETGELTPEDLPSLEWLLCFGGSHSEASYAVQQTSDGGYVIAGFTNSSDGDLIIPGNQGNEDAFLAKLSPAHTVEWVRSIGGSGADYGLSVKQTTDGGFILGGYTNSTDGTFSAAGPHGGWDAFAARLDSNGTLLWAQCIGGSYSDHIYSVQQTSDGGFILGGSTGSSDGDFTDAGRHNYFDAFAVKLNSSGALQWARCVGGYNPDYGYSIQQTNDDGYILAGSTNSSDGDLSAAGFQGNWDAFTAKITATGTIEWVRCVGGPLGVDYGYSVQQTKDGGFILAGQARSIGGDFTGAGFHENPDPEGVDYPDAFVSKMSAVGSIEWVRCIGGTAHDSSRSVQQTSDGGFILGGTTFSSDGDFRDAGYHGYYDAFVVKLSNTGTVQWARCIGSPMEDENGFSVQQTSDGGYLLTGLVESDGGDISGSGYHGSMDAFLAKVPNRSTLVAHYTFNENATDLSGNGHDGTVHGAILVPDRFGNPNGAYSFDGQDDFIEIADHPDLKPYTVTLAAWVNVQQLGPDRLGEIFFKQNTRTTYFEGYTLCADYSHQCFSGGVSSSSGIQRGAFTGIAEKDQWYFVTLTADNQDLSIFLNGELQNTTQTGYSLDYGSYPLYMGGRADEYSFNGIIDEAWVYSEKFTDEKVRNLYLQTSKQFFIVSPNTVTNTTNVKIQIYGQNFTEGIQVLLEKEGIQVVSAQQVFYSSPSMLVTTFDLSSIPLGEYDITLELPDGTRQTVSGALSVKALPEGVIFENTHLQMSPGIPQTFSFTVPDTQNLFVTLQKVQYPGDPHWSWDGTLSLVLKGTEVANSRSTKDQIFHLVNPEPGEYNITVTSTSQGTGILRAWIALPAFPDGNWVVDPIYRPYGSTFRQIEIGPNQSYLNFSAQTISDWSYFNVYHDQWGTGQHWISSGGSGTTLRIPNPPAGLYIVEFLDPQMISGGSQYREVMLKASTKASSETPPVYLPSLSGFTPVRGGNTGTITMEITGAWLEPNASVSLTQNGTIVVSALSVNGTLDKRTLSAVFDLTEQPAGSYNVTVTNPDGTTINSTTKFTIEEGGQSKFWTEIFGREKIRVGRPATYILNYGNKGTLDMPAPLISLTTDPPSSTISIRFPPSTEWRQMNGPFTVIARGPDENPDILPAGSSYSMEIEVNTNEYGEFTLVSLPYGGDPIFTPRTVESAIDAAAPAPGIALTFGRTYPGGYSAYQGPFGYGWVHTYDLQLEPFGDGNYGVRNGDTYLLMYLKQADGTYSSEDCGSNLTVNPDGSSVIVRNDGSALSFNANKKPVTISDLNGNQVTLTYTGSQLTEIRHSDGDRFTLEYGPTGRITRFTDQAGRQTIYSYNPEHTLLTSVIAPDGSTTQYSYAGGEKGVALIEEVYPGGFTQRFQNDGDGRLISTSINGMLNIPLVYNGETRTTILNDPQGAYVTVRVNEEGKPVRVENVLGAIHRFFYGQGGKLTEIIDPLGGAYRFTYSKENLHSITNPLGYSTFFIFNDEFNKIESITDGRGNTISYTYDDSANLISILYPDSRSENFTYNTPGNIIQKIKRNGDIIKYEYNSRGQPIRVEYPDGSSISYTYDDTGKMLTISNTNGTISFDYNEGNQPIRVVYPDGDYFNYSYNEDYLIQERIDKEGYRTIYSYDDIGNLIQVCDGTGSVIVSYGYDSAGKLTRKTVRNGAYTIFEYDEAGQITKLSNHHKNGTILSQFTYTYDLAGNPISVETIEGLYQYEYDSVGQLTHVIYPDGNSTQYSYDATGNRISVIDNANTTSYSANELDEYSNAGSTVFDYDLNGNLISRNENGIITRYEYDYENRLVKIVSIEGFWIYTYDALGNLLLVNHNGNQTRYSVDPIGRGEVVNEYTSNGTIKSRYLHGIGLISKIDQNNNEFFYHFDSLGHTTAITTDTGLVLNQYYYTPYGEFRQNITNIANPFTFLGEYGILYDGSGLFSIRNRFYDPGLGRFTSFDPLEIVGRSSNLYLYASNNPLKYIDITGMDGAIKTLNDNRYVMPVHSQPWGPPCRNVVIPTNLNEGEARQNYIDNLVDLGKKTEEWWNRQNPQDPGSGDGVPGGLIRGLTLYLQFLLGKQDFDMNVRLNPKMDASDDQGWRPVHLGETPWIPYPPGGNTYSGSGESSIDPEDKVGPIGYDPVGIPRDHLNRSIDTRTLLTYRVDFWNAENATADVCDVWAHDQLDSDLNWSTFGFTSVGFTNWTVPLDGVPSFDIYVDTHPAMNYTVHITGDYNPSTGNITLEYHTLDPITLETPEDPLAGFLPAIETNEIGWFAFTVQPDPGLPTGTKLENQAWVKFDTLDFYPAPPDGPWVNTIDAGAPSSSVSAALMNGSEMVCTFSGSDDSGGSGIKDYTIYMSDNGSAYQPVLNHVKTSPSTLFGVPGHTYRFYSIARDNVGNIEDAPASPDSTVIVPSPTSLTLVLPNGGENYPRGSTRTIQWTYGGSPGSTVMIELLKGSVVNKVLSSNMTIGSGGMGSCTWTIPYNQMLGSDYKIRITSTSNSDYTDTSDAPFSISAGSPITVVSPNGGELWKQGSTQTLRWNYTGDPGSSVKIEVIKGPIVRVITPSVPLGSDGSGSFNFTFPFSAPLGSDYQIRITSTSNATYTDTSDAPFTIIPPITVVSPNGGEEWQQGSTQTIQWDYIGNPGPTVKIEALRGDTVLAVISPGTLVGTGGLGSLPLTLPVNAPLGTDFRIRISSTSNPIYIDTSDSPFIISANTSSSISVVSPNGGENWVQGSNQTLQWTYTGNPGPLVKIEALRNGTVLAVITPGTSIGSSGSGSYNLTFPYNTPLGSGYQIRVSSTSNPGWTDTSNAPFTILPAITLATPNGGENYSLGSNLSMSWTYSGNPGSMVNIDVLKGPTVLKTLPSIPIGTGGSGSLIVTIPASTPPGSDYTIRVASASYPSCFDASNGTFSIGVPV